MYAVVKTGGKQYRVQEGRPVKVDRLVGDPGDSVELGEVLLLADGDDVTVGAPTVAGARVLGTIREQGRDRKVVVFRYKAKTRARKKTGHRQHFTRVMIDDILPAGASPKEKAERKAAVAPVEAPVDEPAVIEPAVVEPAVVDDAPVAEATVEAAPEAKPKRTRKKAE